MKRLSFVALLLLAVFMTSCDGLGGGDAANIDKSLIVGKWMTADGQYSKSIIAMAQEKNGTSEMMSQKMKLRLLLGNLMKKQKISS